MNKEKQKPALSRVERVVPELRFPEFANDGEWKNKQLDSLCKFVRGPFGGALKKEIFVKKGYAVYEQSQAIYNQFNVFRYFINEGKFEELKRFAVNADDIIMSCSGTMGKFSIVPKTFKKGVINQALLKLTVKENLVVDFVKISLELPVNQNKLLAQSAGGAIKNVVGVSELKKIEISIPPLKEQQKIANCLSSLDNLLKAETEKLDHLKDHKKGLLQQLFPAKGETKPQFRFPEFVGDGDWEEKEIGQLFRFKQGVQVPIKNQHTTKEDGMVRFIRIIDITGNSELPRYINNPGVDHIITKEDLFMIRYGTPGAISIGFEGVIANNLFRLIWKSSSSIKSLFWYYAFLKMEKKIYSLSGSSSMPAISFSTLDNLEIKFPKNPKEQQKIANCLSSADDLIKAQTAKIETLKDHKKGLMQQLFPNVNELAV